MKLAAGFPMSKRGFACVAIVLGGALVSPLAAAQAVDTTDWKCEYCPFASGQEADLTVGATNVSDDAAYLGSATGYDEEGVYANVDGEGYGAGDNYRMRWTAEDLGLDSRFAEIEGSRLGKFDYNIAYRELPYRRFFTTSSVFGESSQSIDSISVAALTLPGSWVRGPSTTAMQDQINANRSRRNIESDRRIFDAGGRYHASSRFSFSADYRRQEQDGRKMVGGSFFTNASQLAMPFDYVTDEVDFGLRYAGDKGFVSLLWYLSDFENENLGLAWENPFTSIGGATEGARAQAPDSRFQQLSLSGGYGFAEQRTSVSFSAAIGNIEQDASLLPYTINDSLSTSALPRSSLNGDIDTKNFAFAVSSRVLDKTQLKLSYRYDERDNKTEQATWTRVIVDSFVSNDPELNIPYSFERSTLALSADYDLFEQLRLSAGYDRKTIDRDFQEVAEQTEDIGWGRARWRPHATLDIDLRGGASKRDIDRYNEDVAVTFGQNPLLRKYNLAYRYRVFGEARITAAPPQAPVSLSFTALFADDQYSRSELGMLEGDELSMTADISWTISPKSSLYVMTGFDDFSSRQAGSESFSSVDWRADNQDEFLTVGAGIRLRQIAERFDLQLDYSRSDGTSKISVDQDNSGQSGFPDLRTELDYVRARLSYATSDRMNLALNLRYQRFTAQDWALEGVSPATIPVFLSLGAQPYDEEQFIVGIAFDYRMGGDTGGN